MEALSKLANERRFLMVGDPKLVSYPNLAAMIKAKVSFIQRRLHGELGMVPPAEFAVAHYHEEAPARLVVSH